MFLKTSKDYTANLAMLIIIDPAPGAIIFDANVMIPVAVATIIFKMFSAQTCPSVPQDVEVFPNFSQDV